jgi:lipopolysaccharide transport system permease protein
MFARNAKRSLGGIILEIFSRGVLLKQNVLVIKPGSVADRFWRDLWSYRELFLVLAWRDVSVHYKQTAIGLLWALVRPFLTMVVFTIIFGRLAGLPSEAGAPYALLVFAALLPWNLFATSLASAGSSLVGNSSLISKVYFPRLIIPAAAVVASLVDFAVSLAILFGLMAWYRFAPGWQLLLLPIFTALAVFAALGPGLYFSSMTAKYRDFVIIVPFALQLGLYVSPIGFSANIIPEKWRLIYGLNPLVGIIDGFRWCILRNSELDWTSILTGVAVAVLMLWLGLRHFRSTEATFADVI